MRVVILGSGTSAGVPVLGCTCEVCRSTDPKSKRTRASIFVECSPKQRLLIDTAPEMRLQMLAAGLSRADAVLYTHMHADHTHGFDDLRAFYFHEKSPVPVYLLERYQDEMRQRFSYAFRDTGYIGTKPQIELHTIPENASFSAAGQSIESIVLPHGNVVSAAFLIGNFAYATDFKAFSAAQIKAWRGRIDTMVASGIHFGQHPTHSVIPETLALFEALQVRRGILSHLSHDVDHDRDQKRLPPNISFAYDGMIIDLDE